MRMFVCVALLAAGVALAGCQAVGTGAQTDPALVQYCLKYGFGPQGDVRSVHNYERLVRDAE